MFPFKIKIALLIEFGLFQKSVTEIEIMISEWTQILNTSS